MTSSGRKRRTIWSKDKEPRGEVTKGDKWKGLLGREVKKENKSNCAELTSKYSSSCSKVCTPIISVNSVKHTLHFPSASPLQKQINKCILWRLVETKKEKGVKDWGGSDEQ